MVVVMIIPVMMNICHYQQSVFSMPFWELLSIFNQTSESIFKYWPREKAKIRKRIALDLHIAMFTFDIISCVQFTINT